MAIAAALAGFTAAFAQEQASDQHLAITGRHRFVITYDYYCRWPAGHGTAIVHLPVPPNTGSQHIENFSSSLGGVDETDDANPPQHFLTRTLRHDPDDDREMHWRVRIVGIFQMRQLEAGRSGLRGVTGRPAPGEFLDSTESINWDTESFRSWLDDAGLRRRHGEAAAAYGRRLFDYLRENGEYEYPPETAWTAAAGCRRLRTDCGGFSLIFTAACRANHIPARLLAGQWFTVSNGDVLKRQAHVIAEFFDPTIGWIPEDLSSSLMRVRGFRDTDFFGRDPGYFLAWHDGTDFHLSVPDGPAKKVQWIQNPSPWFSEDAEDAADSSSHHWTLSEAP